MADEHRAQQELLLARFWNAITFTFWQVACHVPLGTSLVLGPLTSCLLPLPLLVPLTSHLSLSPLTSYLLCLTSCLLPPTSYHLPPTSAQAIALSVLLVGVGVKLAIYAPLAPADAPYALEQRLGLGVPVAATSLIPLFHAVVL